MATAAAAAALPFRNVLRESIGCSLIDLFTLSLYWFLVGLFWCCGLLGGSVVGRGDGVVVAPRQLLVSPAALAVHLESGRWRPIRS